MYKFEQTRMLNKATGKTVTFNRDITSVTKTENGRAERGWEPKTIAAAADLFNRCVGHAARHGYEIVHDRAGGEPILFS